jgi:hypothetical protein
MHQIPKAPNRRPLIRIILEMTGRVALTAIHVLGATIKATTSGGNAPLLPPSTKPSPKPQDYRP